MTNANPCAADVRFGADDCQTLLRRRGLPGMTESLRYLSQFGQWCRAAGQNVRQRVRSLLHSTRSSISDALARRDTGPGRTSSTPSRREDAVASLQKGVDALSSILVAVRENLERQSRRQDELAGYLSCLPQAQQSQAQALASIAESLLRQGEREQQIGQVLTRMTEASGSQREALESIGARMNDLGQHNQAISENLRQVGASLEAVGRSSQSSTAALGRLHEELASRNTEIEQLLACQNWRVSLMLIVAVVLSVAAAIGVSVVGFLLLRRLPSGLGLIGSWA